VKKVAQQEFGVDVKALQCAAIEAGVGTSIMAMAKATGLDRNTIANIYSKKIDPVLMPCIELPRLLNCNRNNAEKFFLPENFHNTKVF